MGIIFYWIFLLVPVRCCFSYRGCLVKLEIMYGHISIIVLFDHVALALHGLL